MTVSSAGFFASSSSGMPRDVAAAIVFLASERLSGHISGAILPIAGGMEGRLLHPDAL